LRSELPAGVLRLVHERLACARWASLAAPSARSAGRRRGRLRPRRLAGWRQGRLVEYP